MRRTIYVATVGEMRNLFTIVLGKPEGKNSLDNIDAEGMIKLRWSIQK
jgi:hypothetical protein